MNRSERREPALDRPVHSPTHSLDENFRAYLTGCGFKEFISPKTFECKERAGSDVIAGAFARSVNTGSGPLTLVYVMTGDGRVFTTEIDDHAPQLSQLIGKMATGFLDRPRNLELNQSLHPSGEQGEASTLTGWRMVRGSW